MRLIVVTIMMIMKTTITIIIALHNKLMPQVGCSEAH